MPFIDDQELESLQKQIDASIEQKDEAEAEVEELQEDIAKQKKKGLTTNIVFGVLAGLGLGLSAFLFLNQGGLGSSVDVDEVKLAERTRVIDSLEMVSEESEGEELEEETADASDADGAAKNVKSGLKDKTIYSVQVKAFSENKHPVMSTALAGIATSDEYFKYSVGIFNGLEEAHALRKELISIGFRDAFVASYVNGERKEIHKPGAGK